MKIIFFGTPEFSVPFLQALIDEPEIEVVAIVAQPDKAQGRGKQIHPGQVSILAQNQSIPILQPASLKNDKAFTKSLSQYQADLFVVVAYGKIIPGSILEIPPKGAVNVHPSLLPKHRGPSPMQWAIAQGDIQTGVSIMLLDKGMDTGPLLATESISLDGDETYGSLVNKVHQMGPRLLIRSIKSYMAGALKPIAQEDANATETRLLTREDGHIDWTESIIEIERKLRAYHPWPGMFAIWERKPENHLRIKILTIKPADFRADVPPGTVVSKEGKLYVDCKDGTLEILELQPEGKQKMKAAAFIQGYSDFAGARLV